MVSLMSKKDKLLKRLFSVPGPKDFEWRELITLMEQCGFKATCRGGSHYMFEHTTGYCKRIPRPHPDGTLKSYQVKEAKAALIEIGVSYE